MGGRGHSTVIQPVVNCSIDDCHICQHKDDSRVMCRLHNGNLSNTPDPFVRIAMVNLQTKGFEELHVFLAFLFPEIPMDSNAWILRKTIQRSFWKTSVLCDIKAFSYAPFYYFPLQWYYSKRWPSPCPTFFIYFTLWSASVEANGYTSLVWFFFVASNSPLCPAHNNGKNPSFFVFLHRALETMVRWFFFIWANQIIMRLIVEPTQQQKMNNE